MAADAQQIGLSIIVEGTVMANKELITEGGLGNPEVTQINEIRKPKLMQQHVLQHTTAARECNTSNTQ